MRNSYTLVLALFVLCLFVTDRVQAQDDTRVYAIDTLVVSAKRTTSYLKGNANQEIRWDMNMMHHLPKILGNADPMHYTQLLPGVQTNSEYNSGLYVQGCDNSHNLVAIEGVPIYNASHLLGFFSVFNPSHFSYMAFSRSAQHASLSNHLGGMLDMRMCDTIINRFSEEFSIGPMSSQGTVRIPLNKKSSLVFSLRSAYLNLLYKRWLEMEGNQVAYGFSDVNVTHTYQWNDRNQIMTDFYWGYDDVRLGAVSMKSDNLLKWQNLKLSVSWKHQTKQRASWEQTCYLTGYDNRFTMGMSAFQLKLPSSIMDVGYKGIYRQSSWQAGVDLIYHRVQPQSPELSGTYQSQVPQTEQQAYEAALFADYEHDISSSASVKAGVRSTFYHTRGHRYTSLDPMLAVIYQLSHGGKLTGKIQWQHQYLFRAGFTSLGLPIEFWFAADENFSPQHVCGLSLAYDRPLWNGDWHLSLEGYYKKLYNQAEYKGNIFGFLNTTYSLKNSVLIGNGENYGINVMLNKRVGALTGWVSYTYGRALRVYEQDYHIKRYPASHERIHELNLVGTYQLSPQWSLGATFVLASGNPYTRAKYVYVLGERILAEYGEYNAERLNPYARLDLSLNYSFRKKGKAEKGLNFSLYNATAHSNELFYDFSFDTDKGIYGYDSVGFVMKVLPSISFYCRF